MRNLICKKYLLLFLLCVAVFPKISAHPLGMTITNLKYSNGTLTLSTRIVYRDFMYEFQKEARNPKKYYIKSGIDKNDQKDFTKYFKKYIEIWVNNKLLPFSKYTIKFELHEAIDYMFVVDFSYKTKMVEGFKVKIRNTILLNTLSSEKHLIYVSMKDSTSFSHDIITLDKSNPEFEFIN